MQPGIFQLQLQLQLLCQSILYLACVALRPASISLHSTRPRLCVHTKLSAVEHRRLRFEPLPRLSGAGLWHAFNSVLAQQAELSASETAQSVDYRGEDVRVLRIKCGNNGKHPTKYIPASNISSSQHISLHPGSLRQPDSLRFCFRSEQQADARPWRRSLRHVSLSRLPSATQPAERQPAGSALGHIACLLSIRRRVAVEWPQQQLCALSAGFEREFVTFAAFSRRRLSVRAFRRFHLESFRWITHVGACASDEHR